MIFLKALITGASGFVGQVMSQVMLNNNIESIGVSRSRSYINGNETDQYKCDVLEKRKLKQILRSSKPDYIVHLASPAFIPDSYNKPKETYEVIFKGTLNLLDCINELDLSTKILYISSADIYGNNSKKLLSEEEAYDPINPYSSAKACSEILCRQFYNTYGLNVVVARPFNHTGPGQSINFVCSSFAYQIAGMINRSERKLYTGNVDVRRDFLDVRDVANAYYDLLKYGKSGQDYNVCSGVAISIRDIIGILFNSANIYDYEIVPDPLKIRKNDIPIRAGDNKKLRALSNWAPRFSIEETMSDLFSYWKEKK